VKIVEVELFTGRMPFLTLKQQHQSSTDKLTRQLYS